MWYTKSYNRYTKATVTVEADSKEEAAEIIDNWLDDNANNILFAEALEGNTDKCDYWLTFPQDTPFEKADITIEKPKKLEKTNDRVDLSIYVVENPKIRHSINYHKYYKYIAPEEFLALIKDWSKNFSLKIDKCYDGPDNLPVIRVLAIQKPEISSKLDLNYVEVK